MNLIPIYYLSTKTVSQAEYEKYHQMIVYYSYCSFRLTWVIFLVTYDYSICSYFKVCKKLAINVCFILSTNNLRARVTRNMLQLRAKMTKNFRNTSLTGEKQFSDRVSRQE